VRACVRVCVCMCVWVDVGVGVCVCVHAVLLSFLRMYVHIVK